MPQSEYELYKRIKLLGEGSFGKAYLVECLKDKSTWVIKYMDLTAMSNNEKDETLREAKILEYLQHPNIVKFREVYRTKKGKLCIVMEYADGGDLALRIKQAKGTYFSENQILDWFTQICLAIKHVHDRKIIHRDLKGQNIFVTKDNRIKLGDFGIARVLKKTMEKAKTMVGTPYYISPEIIEGKTYSLMTDIWSLGVVLYELCTFKPPFNAESLHFLALKIVKGQYTPIPNHYSKELKNLIAMMLTVDPRRRPTIQDILRFLTETIRNSEFSHTILHNRVFDPKVNINNLNIVNNELPCPDKLLKPQSAAPILQQQNNIMKPPALKDEPYMLPQFGAVAGGGAAAPIKKAIEAQKPVQQQQQFGQKPNDSKLTQQDPPKDSNRDKKPQQQQQIVQKPPSQQLKNGNQNRPPSAQIQKQPQILQQNPPQKVQQRPQSGLPVQQIQKQKEQAAPQNNFYSNDKQKQNHQKIVVQNKRPQSVDRSKEDLLKQQNDQERQDERIRILKEQERKKKEEAERQKMLEQQRELERLKEVQKQKEIIMQKQKDIERQKDIEKLREQNRKQEQDKQKEMDKFKEMEKQQRELERQKEIEALRQEQQRHKEVAYQQQKDIQAKQKQQKQKQQQQQQQQQIQDIKPASGQQLLDKMQEKNKEFEQMLQELESVLDGLNQAVDKLPEGEDKGNIFDYQTMLIPQDREDDDSDDVDSYAQGQKENKAMKGFKPLSKEEEECFEVLNGNKMEVYGEIYYKFQDVESLFNKSIRIREVLEGN